MKLTPEVLETIKKSLKICDELRIKSGGTILKLKETLGSPTEIYFELRKGGRYSSSDTVAEFDHALLVEVIKHNFSEKEINEILLLDHDGAFARIIDDGRMEPHRESAEKRRNG